MGIIDYLGARAHRSLCPEETRIRAFAFLLITGFVVVGYIFLLTARWAGAFEIQIFLLVLCFQPFLPL